MTETAVKPVVEKRIPATLSKNPIFKEFCNKYLETLDQIAEYNREVLADKDSEWNAGKVLEKAREFARPTDKSKEVNKEILAAIEKHEAAINAASLARKAVLDLTSKELGISLSATAERNAEIEAPLKEKRKDALVLGQQLSKIAEMTSDETVTGAITAFLKEFELPAVGRNQTTSFGNDGTSTPKYRVSVEITKDGNVLMSGEGFSKTAINLSKPVFGYERGKAPKADDLRAAWETAGNSAEETKVNPVEFDDNGLHFKITKK